MAFVSAVNQPERVHINSSDDPTDTGIFQLWPVPNEKYYEFQAQFKTPILNPERSQLLRATIPNIVLNIPDYQLVFWYKRQDISGNETIHNVRILPSWIDPAEPWAVSTGLPINRQLVNYQDFVQILNQAAAATDDAATNPYHVPGDLVFQYDAVRRLISVVPQNLSSYAYALLGYSRPELETVEGNVYYIDNVVGGGRVQQPFVPKLPLNLRVGFCSGDNQIPGFANTFVAGTFADLVYSQNVYLLANYAQGSGLGSGGQHNIIATIPIAAPPLGVANFSAPLVNWLTRIAKEIYEIKITMLDDNYQPYLLPNSALVNIELGFSYIKV